MKRYILMFAVLLTLAPLQSLRSEEDRSPPVAGQDTQTRKRAGEIPSERTQEKPGSIGYPTVAEALIAVQKGMDAEARVERGWTIVETKEKGVPVHWFFTQKGHPAHPAAIKRTMTYKEGAWDIGMAVLCEAPKAACDKLTEEFRVINERLEKSWNG